MSTVVEKPPVTDLSPKTDVTECFPVSVGQRMMWMMDHYQGAYGALNCPIILRINGPLDRSRLESAWLKVLELHESLRSCFTRRGQSLARTVMSDLRSNIVIESLNNTTLSQQAENDDAEPSDALAIALREELRKPMAIEKTGSRIRLWRVADQSYCLCITQHHLVTDAISCAIVSRDLGRAYSNQPLSAPTGQYSDFVEWETSLLDGRSLQRLQSYWVNKLTGVQGLPLPSREAVGDSLEDDTMSLLHETIDAASASRLASNASRFRVSKFVFYYTMFCLYLSRLTGQYDIAVCTLLANRSERDFQDTVGFLANMVVLRLQIKPDESFESCLSKASKVISGAIAHQSLPYQLLPPGIVPAECSTGIVFQLFPEATHQTEIDSLTITPVDAPDGLARRFDLDMALMPGAEGTVKVAMATSNRRFRARWRKQFLAGFIKFLNNS